MSWLEEIEKENQEFKEKIDTDILPVDRKPCPYAVITCMDPRINLESVGILPFKSNGEIQSQVRVIRTIGGFSENRSLVVGIHLAGFKEIAVIMHTDCGCSLAYHKIDAMIENMSGSLTKKKLEEVKALIGEPFQEKLLEWLRAFQDPKEAVQKEVDAIKASPFIPDGLIIHGLLYDLSTGGIETLVDGYQESKTGSKSP